MKAREQPSPLVLYALFLVLLLFFTAGSLLHSKLAHPLAHPLTYTIYECDEQHRSLWNLSGTLL